jgi:type I restriction-modification system DNA methylase subunit
VKPRLTEMSIRSWRDMVAKPSQELQQAFNDANNFYSDFFNFPLFDNIKFEDVSWNENHIKEILLRLSSFDFDEIGSDVIGSAYEKHLSIDNRKRIGQYYTYDYVVDYMVNSIPISKDKTYFDPACGSGGFLIRILDQLAKKYRAKEKSIFLRNAFLVQTSIRLRLSCQRSIYSFEASDLEKSNSSTTTSKRRTPWRNP